MSLKFVNGHYFPYCQFCEHDEKCELKHYEFLGVKSSEEILDGPFEHENLSSKMSLFQQETPYATCGGRIGEHDSFFYRLACECGTVISSLTLSNAFGGFLCGKFEPNEKGRERMELTDRIAKEKGIPVGEVSPDDLPELDPDYHAIMTH